MTPPQILLLHGDCRTLADRWAHATICVTDPPYGINYRVQERSGKTRAASRLRSLKSIPTSPMTSAVIKGDSAPFDPTPLITLPKWALFGANYYAETIPALHKRRWVVWDKRRDSTPDCSSDAELICLSAAGALRIHRQKWRGVIREGEEHCSRQKKAHPNQKPVALLDYLLTLLGAVPGDVVADPYTGSGSTGVAAVRRGCSFVGCEIDREYFLRAVDRITAEGIGLVVCEEAA